MIEAILAKPVTTLAYGWRLERRDGVTLGFTSHDRDVWRNGLLLRAAPGMEPTSVVERLGFENGGLDVRGALTSDALAVRDIEAGRWDGAALTLFTFDWSDPDEPSRSLASGQLGAVSYAGDRFETVFNGPATQLKKAVAPITSPTCRAFFCGAECGLNPMRFTRTALAAANAGSSIILLAGTGLAINRYATGTLRWLEGPNTGLKDIIVSNGTNSVALATPPKQPITTAVRVELFEGCDKTAQTCQNIFSNMVNFRGEPHLPGNDILTRYPGAS
jgi:uncharacterized phage protein (TIGR02218 family)